MTTANADIKATAKQKGVYLYELAEHYGMFDTALSRKLRRELSSAEKAEILAAIELISAAKQKEKSA